MEKVTVTIRGKVAFLTFEENGVRKMGMTDRAGLTGLSQKLDSALNNPLSNTDGSTRFYDKS
jgi:hypothetical protein